MALPFLPGNSFNPRLGKEKFHLSHHFDCNNEIPMWVGERKPDVGGEPRVGQDTRKMHSQIPAGKAPGNFQLNKICISKKSFREISI